jgi:hypothetical protein
MKGPVLAATVAAVGLAVVLSGCGGPPAIHTSARATAAPQRYQRIGGAAQGVSMEIPGSWLVVDLARQTPVEAFKWLRSKLPPDNPAIFDQIEDTLTALATQHAVYAVDSRSMGPPPGQYPTSIAALCGLSGTAQTGRASLPFLREQTSEVGNGGYDVRRTDVRVGTVPGLEITYEQSSQLEGVMYGAQLDALPSEGLVCSITAVATDAVPSGVISEVARTVRYP